METETEIALIGAGPIGLEIGVELKRLGTAYRHFEAGQIGSTIQWFAPGTTFFSSPERIAIGGVPLEVPNQGKATREDYLRYMRAVATQFSLSVETYREVRQVKRDGERFILKVGRSLSGFGAPGHHDLGPADQCDEIVCARKIILSIGDLHRPQMLGVPGENLSHVSHYLADPHAYFRKKVLIVGGRNSAVEAAIRLYRSGVSVSLCFRAAELSKSEIKYWLYPEILHLIRTGQIGCYPSAAVQEITEDGARLKTAGGDNIELPSDFVLLLTGYEQNQALFSQLGISIEGPERIPVFNPETMETNVPGVYLAGTASAGKTKRHGYREFIETGHAHVGKILRALGSTGGTLIPEIPVELRES